MLPLTCHCKKLKKTSRKYLVVDREYTSWRRIIFSSLFCEAIKSELQALLNFISGEREPDSIKMCFVSEPIGYKSHAEVN